MAAPKIGIPFRSFGDDRRNMFDVRFTSRYTLMRALSFCLDSLEADPRKKIYKISKSKSIKIIEGGKKAGSPQGLGSHSGGEALDMGSLPSRPACDESKVQSALDFADYVLYFPLYLCGPLMTYKEFRLQAAEPRPIPPKRMCLELMKLLARIALVECALRTFYRPSAILIGPSRPPMNLLESWVFAHALTWMAFLESALPWSLSRICAMAQGLQPVDDAPEFVTAVTVSCRRFMRSFHVSWSQWLRQYVYVPLGGGGVGLAGSLAASLALHGVQR
ncbi:unnamed protein product, partial [Ostreobium quekettii]